MKKNILFILPSFKGGGAEKVLLNLLKLIDYDRYEIDLIIGLKGGIREDEIPSNVNIKFIYPNFWLRKLTTFLFNKFNSRKLFFLFGKKFAKNYDVGISFLDSMYSEFLFTTKGNINKKVIVLHSSYLSYSNEIKIADNKTISRLKQRYLKTDTIISVSNDALNEFITLFGKFKDMRVIYNPINVKNIIKQANSKKKIKINKKTINLIAVGNLIEVKGYHKLVEACNNIKIDEIDFHLNILGSGHLQKELQNKINELNLNENIDLLGYVPVPYKWMSESDIYIMTSDAEGLPTALCEAMILGKPTLVTNVPGCREVVENGKYGLMVDNDVLSITNGLRKLILSKKDRTYYKKQSLIRSKMFDDKITLDKYYEIFNM